ncbi:MAG: hypothetical protein ABSC32_17455, partial [Steroidobacteraceae bacterium]
HLRLSELAAQRVGVPRLARLWRTSPHVFPVIPASAPRSHRSGARRCAAPVRDCGSIYVSP